MNPIAETQQILALGAYANAFCDALTAQFALLGGHRGDQGWSIAYRCHRGTNTIAIDVLSEELIVVDFTVITFRRDVTTLHETTGTRRIFRSCAYIGDANADALFPIHTSIALADPVRDCLISCDPMVTQVGLFNDLVIHHGALTQVAVTAAKQAIPDAMALISQIRRTPGTLWPINIGPMSGANEAEQ